MGKEDDTKALEEAGYDSDDVGRGNKAVTEKSVAEETGSTSEEAAAAGHDFRDDSGARTGEDAQHFEEAPSDGQQETESGISLYPEDKKG